MKTKRILALVVCLTGLSVAAWFSLRREREPVGWVADFTDNFNRADGNIANGWTGSFDATFSIVSNEVNTLGGTYASVKAMSPAPSKGKQKAQCKLTLQGTTGSSLLCIRQQAGAISQYAAGVGSGILYIFKMAAGTTSVLNNSADLGLASGGSYIVTIEADGTAISATIAAAATPNTLLATVNTTDGSYATGLQGLAGNVVNSKIDDFASYEWVDVPTLTPSPTTGFADGETSITITASAALWLSEAPDFDVDVGSIVSTTVLTDTTATVVYQAGSATATATFTDNTTGGEAEFEVYAPLVLLEGDSQMTGAPYNTLPTDLIAGVTTTVDTQNFSTGAHTAFSAIADVATELDPVVGEERRIVVVVLFMGTNDYYLDDKTGQQVYDILCEWADDVHALTGNCKVVVATVPNRDWPGDGGEYPADDPDINDRINAGNVLIKANADGKFDRVWDVNGILNAISTDPNEWTSDGVHLDQDAADAIQPRGTQLIQQLLDGTADPTSAWSAYINDVYADGVWADGVWGEGV
jgi:hypothetical protein